MRHPAFDGELEPATLASWYRHNRRRTAALFDIVRDDAYYLRPIALRNPIVFYEGHLPAFSVNTLVKAALGRSGVDERLETLFARGIDPGSADFEKPADDVWPRRECVREYACAADQLVEEAIAAGDLEDEGAPMLRNGEAALTVLEHEQMHHETLLYLLHNLPYASKRAAAPLTRTSRVVSPEIAENDFIRIPRGLARLGADASSGFGWDNEFPAHEVEVPPFSIQRQNVTNQEFLEFIHAGGYERAELWSDEGREWVVSNSISHPHFWVRRDGQWFWRGQFEEVPLPLTWPVYVTFAEASAYARWRGARLPTEAEYDRAAYGSPDGIERRFPWGDQPPDETRGNFDFAGWDPVPVGSYPGGASAWGVHDLVGNGWEWTSTLFDGFSGFEPMASYPVYSADFFDGAHYVMKGASPVTGREMIRRSFRNWFRPTYPYVYATFRCVR